MSSRSVSSIRMRCSGSGPHSINSSPHVLATAIVASARRRGLELVFPEDVREELGSGIRGRVNGRNVGLGKASWVAVEHRSRSRLAMSGGAARWRDRRA